MNLTSRLVLAAASTAALLACETLPPIDVPFDGETTIPACPVGEECPEIPALPEIPGVSDFNLADQPEFQSAGGVIDQIEDMQLSELTIDITEGATDFSWLTSMTFNASSSDGSLPTVAIAELTLAANDKGGTTIKLTPTGENLAEYVKGGNLLISAKPVGRPPPVETTLAIHGVFQVTFATGL